jgi:hypothetical protein
MVRDISAPRIFRLKLYRTILSGLGRIDKKDSMNRKKIFVYSILVVAIVNSCVGYRELKNINIINDEKNKFGNGVFLTINSDKPEYLLHEKIGIAFNIINNSRCTLNLKNPLSTYDFAGAMVGKKHTYLLGNTGFDFKNKEWKKYSKRETIRLLPNNTAIIRVEDFLHIFQPPEVKYHFEPDTYYVYIAFPNSIAGQLHGEGGKANDTLNEYCAVGEMIKAGLVSDTIQIILKEKK